MNTTPLVSGGTRGFSRRLDFISEIADVIGGGFLFPRQREQVAMGSCVGSANEYANV